MCLGVPKPGEGGEDRLSKLLDIGKRLSSVDGMVDQCLYIYMYFCIQNLRYCYAKEWRESVNIFVILNPEHTPLFIKKPDKQP